MERDVLKNIFRGLMVRWRTVFLFLILKLDILLTMLTVKQNNMHSYTSNFIVITGNQHLLTYDYNILVTFVISDVNAPYIHVT